MPRGWLAPLCPPSGLGLKEQPLSGSFQQRPGWLFGWKLNVIPLAIHWPELVKRPHPDRKYHPSQCPESRKE